VETIVLDPSRSSDRRLGIELIYRAVVLTVKEGTHEVLYDWNLFPPDQWCVLVTSTRHWLARATTPPTTGWHDTVLGVGRPKGSVTLVVGRLHPGEIWNSACPRIPPMPRPPAKMPETPRETPKVSRPPQASKPVSARPANDFDSSYAKYRGEKDMIAFANRMFQHGPSGPW
jgi:hypothetical protein